MQGNRLEAYDDNHWDEGTGLAIAATGAVVAGSAAALAATAYPAPVYGAPATLPPDASFTTAPATPAPTLAAPCANPTVVSAGGVSYTGCGSTWYTLAYGPDGPAYVQSGPPPGS